MLVYMDATLTLNSYCTAYSRTWHFKALLYTEHDHERERDHKHECVVRIGLRISRMCMKPFLPKATTNEAGNWFVRKVAGLTLE